jgi:hypothetical protein
MEVEVEYYYTDLDVMLESTIKYLNLYSSHNIKTDVKYYICEGQYLVKIILI